jgi:threonine dehydrogenase-like Zn-dependent dehydrogenase
MRVTTIHAPGDVRLEERPDPTIQAPTEAIVRVTASCICGSDLWSYRGENKIEPGTPIGHEIIGVVEAVGAEVRGFGVGDYVVVPFDHCDNTCPVCRKGMQAACQNLGFTEGGQGELVTVHQADGSLVRVPETPSDDQLPALLTLADVMATGWHAAVASRVEPGSSVAVVGDGAVGLCGVIAAKRLGAEQIVIMGRHSDRIALAREFGATDVVSERGAEAVERVQELTGGDGAHSVLECVGTGDAMRTAVEIARPGGAVGRVGVPHYEAIPAAEPAFFGNITVGGGPAPARAYLNELLPDVLEGRIEPGRVFDRVVGLDEVPDGYRAMNEREALKVMVNPS